LPALKNFQTLRAEAKKKRSLATFLLGRACKKKAYKKGLIAGIKMLQNKLQLYFSIA
jgi:hypothetical protein